MKKATGIAAIVIASATFCLSLVSLFLSLSSLREKAADNQDTQYVLYLGTNDKDTNAPVFSPEDARAEAEKILISHFGGYTIQDAQGGWEDAGTLYQEYTLVIYLSDTTLEDVHAAAKDMIRTFNQSSVLIQSNRTVTEFYSGEN